VNGYRIRTIIAVLVILTFLIWMNYLRAIRGDYNSFDVRYWLGTAMLAAGLLWVVGSQIVEPMYRWWKGVRYGIYTIAEITNISRLQLHYGDAMDGRWQFLSKTANCETNFRLNSYESGYWIWRLELGSQVHILLHPKKARVLIAIGMIEIDALDRHVVS
jgi:hypothetical protein